MPELARQRADGVIDRSKTRDTPCFPLAAKGRLGVWNSHRGNHLGQRSCASAKTGRTYGRKRSDQSAAQITLRGGGRPQKRKSGSAPESPAARAAKPPTSSMSPSHARWWVSSGRSPARFNPHQRRRDDDLTDTGRGDYKPKISLSVVCGAGGRTMPGSPRVYYELLTLAT